MILALASGIADHSKLTVRAARSVAIREIVDGFGVEEVPEDGAVVFAAGHEQRGVGGTPREGENALGVALKRGQRERGAGSQVIQLDHGISVVSAGRYNVKSLLGVPCDVADASPSRVPQLTPRLLLLEIPYKAGAILRGGGEDMGDLSIPSDLGHVSRVSSSVGVGGSEDDGVARVL